MTRPKVAITYSENTGGVLSLRKAFKDLKVVDCNYRDIVRQSTDTEQIYNNKEKMFNVFKTAKQKAKIFLKGSDGLIISGNTAMIDPRLFGEQLGVEKIDLERAIAELALIHIAIQRGIPLLGICGGHQVLNVYLGGKIGDLNEDDLLEQGIANYREVCIDPNSEFGKIINQKHICKNKAITENFFGTNSQIIKELGGKRLINNKEDYLKVVGRACHNQNNIEVVEAQFGAPVCGVQFHPEISVKGSIIPQLSKEVNDQAQNAEEILKSKKIFEAFKKSVESFYHKKITNLQVKMGQSFADNNVKNQISSEKKVVNKLVAHANYNFAVAHELNEADLTYQKSPITPFYQTISAPSISNTKELIQARIQVLQDKKIQNPVNSKVNKASLQGIFSQLPTDELNEMSVVDKEIKSESSIRNPL